MLAFANRDTHVIQELRLAEDKQRRGPAFTAVVEESILGCAGIMLMWEGVGVAWCAFGPHIDRYAVWMTKHVRRVLDDTMRSLNLHRMEAVVLADNITNMRWIQMLGFTPEVNSIAKQYTPDKRHVVRYEYVP